jgi:GNAT superfamily N-acetyltransferase
MIRRIRASDASQLAALHLATLRTQFTGLAGQNLLACYYRALTSGSGGVGYAKIEDDGGIAGFVCGIWDAAAVRRVLLHSQWWRLLGWGCLCVLFRPRILSDLWQRLIRGRTHDPSAPTDTPCRSGYELRPIAVRGESQGKGIARELLTTLLKDAEARGHGSVYLLTEVDNGRANAFYVKNGFALVGTAGGYNFYRIQVP